MSISPTAGSETPEKEQIFETLSNERRRYVLAYLQQYDDGSVDLGELVSQVAAMENGLSVEKISSDQRKSVYVGLRQTHLPKMDAYNLIEYDADRGEIEPTEATENAKMYLEFVPEHDIPWAVHYAGLSLLLGSILALTWINVYPFSDLGGMVIAGLAVIVVAISAGVHGLYTYRHNLENVYDFEQ
jgi:hypothetical protein